MAWQVDVQADKAAEPPSEDIRILLFQGVRELLFNVVKHAGVKRAATADGPIGAGRDADHT